MLLPTDLLMAMICAGSDNISITIELTEGEVELLKEAIDWTIPFYERQVREFFGKFSKDDSERVYMLD